MYNTNTDSYRATRKPEKENSTQYMFQPFTKKANSSYMTKPAGGATTAAPNSARGGRLDYATVTHAADRKVMNNTSLTRITSTKSSSIDKKMRNEMRMFNQTQ
jgi:hypothetical protein